MALLHFGSEASVQLDFADGVVPDEYGVPPGEPLANVAASTRLALDNPIDYPSLGLCTTPGDRVVITLERSAPQVEQVVAAAVDGLLAAGIGPEGISILLSPSHREPPPADPCRQIAAAVRDQIAVIVHDPTDRKQLAYLAANDASEAILVNRVLHEADFVLPVGWMRSDSTTGYFGIHGSLFPTFSDLKTQQRFRSLGSLVAGNELKPHLIHEVEQVASLLGIYFSMQLVPAAGNRLLHVLAGQSDIVREQGQSLFDGAWKLAASRRSPMVVAAIEGGAEQQTWESFGQAVETASKLADDGGAIAICCELADRPGPAFQLLAAESSRDDAMRRIGKDRPFDTIPAAQLACALNRNKVYLYSRLDPATVEDLDMVPVAAMEELSRLTQRHDSCIILSNAPYVSVDIQESA